MRTFAVAATSSSTAPTAACTEGGPKTSTRPDCGDSVTCAGGGASGASRASSSAQGSSERVVVTDGPRPVPALSLISVVPRGSGDAPRAPRHAVDRDDLAVMRPGHVHPGRQPVEEGRERPLPVHGHPRADRHVHDLPAGQHVAGAYVHRDVRRRRDRAGHGPDVRLPGEREADPARAFEPSRKRRPRDLPARDLDGRAVERPLLAQDLAAMHRAHPRELGGGQPAAVLDAGLGVRPDAGVAARQDERQADQDGRKRHAPRGHSGPPRRSTLFG